jgi:acylphosphatase
MMVAKLVQYSGRVQGVGFRYTACGLAEGFPVSGYVRNLRDGRVELWAEGEAEAIASFLAALSRRMARAITEQTIEDREPANMTGFSIRY